LRARTILLLSGLTAACGDPAGGGTGPTSTGPTSAAETSAAGTTGTTAATSGEAPTDGGSEADAGATTGAASHTIGGSVRGLQGAGLELCHAGEVPGDRGRRRLHLRAPLVRRRGLQRHGRDPARRAGAAVRAEQREGTVAGADVADIVVTCVTPVRHVVVIGIDGFGGAYVPMVATPVLDAHDGRGRVFAGDAEHAADDERAQLDVDDRRRDGRSARRRLQRLGARRLAADADGLRRRCASSGRTRGSACSTTGTASARSSSRASRTASRARATSIETVAAALTWMAQTRPELLFIHLDLVDHAGHFNGWGSDPYVEAAESADALVGEVLAAIDAAGMGPYTAVLVSADHGGEGLFHGADTSLERPIPFIVTGPQVAGGEVQRELRIFDIAATVAALLGVEAPASWLGSPVLEVLAFAAPASDPAATLELLPVSDYVWVYDDTGSGAFTDGSIWRPVVPAGYVSIGDVAHASHAEPGFATLVIRDDPDALRPPLGYEQIWNDKGTLGANDVTIWSPIPPLGYACLGSVATPGHDAPPATGQIRCVHQRYLVRGKASLTWTDAGSLGFQDAGLWTCGDGPEGGLAARSFITRRHHSDPGYPKCWSLVADP
jgi:hypothetical protein